MFQRICFQVLMIASLLFTSSMAHAQRLETPRRHDRPPGPPLSPQEAVAKMTVPEGFSVEIVAAEPNVVNPVAMCIDEKGRFWITESLEYPRKSPGPGQDRVKVLEDTDGDGKVDKTTVFADGLNIPSGIAVGYGGVWVANSPDLLFMQDTDGDLKADKIETVVTGFGRTDTHELPNSLTWGPDGWLYGLNGVFNYSDVKYAETNPNYDPEHPGWKFTCAMFRIHPRTRKFEIFAEGTSNPWGIAINEDGEFFISACVIDHLWHIVETGYYIRQGGPYPPHTWPMGSIVEHKHQKAAYCGITWFDSDAYPKEYRGVLYMGNIHGGCINADIAERHGSTYKAKPHPGFPAKPGAWDNDEYGLIRKTGGGRQSPVEDNAPQQPTTSPDNQAADNRGLTPPARQPLLADFLTANDAWFMPVVQKVGPDGCLYILDWYDRYHCYQDANADPEGIERAKGRLYRVRYKDNPHAQPFDLTTKSDDALIALLGDANVYARETAQRLLSERGTPQIRKGLEEVVRSEQESMTRRLHALWALSGCGDLENDLLGNLIDHDSPSIQKWGIRLAGNKGDVSGPVDRSMLSALFETDLQLRLQATIAARKLSTRYESPEVATISRVNRILSTLEGRGIEASPDPDLLSHVVWQNLKPLVITHPKDVVETLIIWSEDGFPDHTLLVPRILNVLIDTSDPSGEHARLLLTAVMKSKDSDPKLRRECLSLITQLAREGALNDRQSTALTEAINAVNWNTSRDDESRLAAAGMLAIHGDAVAKEMLRQTLIDSNTKTPLRVDSLSSWIASGDKRIASTVKELLLQEETPPELVRELLQCLSRVEDASAPDILLDILPHLENAQRSIALEVLTQRAILSHALLKAIEAKQIDKDAINLNQIARVASFKDEEVQKLVAKIYGQVRSGQRSDRRQMVNNMADFLHGTPGDAERGGLAFKKVCAQCHKIYGEGAEVGPDITRNGRNNWQQLLTNVFDPSAVIGPGYQARILVTTDGRVLTGLAVEESDQRVVLKIQGGKVETIPRDQIEEYKISEASMMPEQLEKQLTPQEIADLFAFLALDKPPSDPEARILPGAPQH